MNRLMKHSYILILLFMASLGLAQEQQKGQQDRAKMIKKMMSKPDGAPQVGKTAPLFKLKSLDGKTATDLKTFQGKKPVVLIFGSYT